MSNPFTASRIVRRANVPSTWTPVCVCTSCVYIATIAGLCPSCVSHTSATITKSVNYFNNNRIILFIYYIVYYPRKCESRSALQHIRLIEKWLRPYRATERETDRAFRLIQVQCYASHYKNRILFRYDSMEVLHFKKILLQTNEILATHKRYEALRAKDENDGFRKFTILLI